MAQKFPAPMDDEEAAINAGIAQDPDAPEATEEEFRRAIPFKDAFPALHAAWKRGRGRPRLPAAKTHLTLRVEPALADHIRAHGQGWGKRVEAVLREAVEAGKL